MFAEVRGSGRAESRDRSASHDGDRAEKRLLEPLSTVVRGVYRLLLGGFVIGALAPLIGAGPHLMWGGSSVCAEDRADYGADSFTSIFAPRPGAEVMARPSYCTDHADGAQRLFDFLGGFPSWVLLMGVLFLLNRLVQGASREGVFTPRVAKLLRVAGWWLLLGCLIGELVEAAAHAALLATLAQDHPFTADSWLGGWEPPYALVLTALGILTFARVMRAGVAMREDLDGTV
ncbi:DUF2975 domain-containing protein [Streptomyces sp. NBC_00247]|uniref:DUF2975 domain-containing protein n=1 Tax=Streptomyces sp. NBC_00247 TaxID=2975689 RepID=UPI002E28CEF3|nr:DUF2975 domain-containing protein [Streptomyces sp. NBC_00247]